ncbi:MAG: hypothetical protein A2745_02430 [Candidatus Harrisonbacteria bacterium RIFCSPHIGHO2_01_FULL_44_13]|uniref:Uncharacterized protein n=1 Tax=Candidatus Harrisonbacteria bacterium RIFCSPLOWO2_01_FULL_44_18 TaxID=1798407 RepID=A0A1G1ZQ42_9BACT|nr:MAG: hypothetical protein A2745_02430 [Candidatus Harrisonbacteria bacterium RIFCSPHIGHO2_01_FULL_44_13]OGY65937.1 MAG: hypothetical protein A3A16_00945 [Candidatus Harrisonbacteria bacterium RIFCSPLOWO2_01_FULL_44_18]
MKYKILFKVYLIWFFRRILPLMVLQVLVLILALKIFAGQVFVAKVFENAAVTARAGYWDFFKYLVSAFFQTRPLIQVVILIMLGFGALILRDIGRALITYAGLKVPGGRNLGE